MKTWIRQEPGTQHCGQIAVAVAADISIMESIYMFGHRRRTTTRQIVHVLRQLGFYDVPDRLVQRKKRPALAIAKLRAPRGGGWHWVVVEGDEYVWDGVYGTPEGTADYPAWLRITSYLPLA